MHRGHFRPKDLLFEIHGFPFASTRAFQVAWVANFKALAQLFARVAYVKLVQAREPHPDRLALSANWVSAWEVDPGIEARLTSRYPT